MAGGERWRAMGAATILLAAGVLLLLGLRGGESPVFAQTPPVGAMESSATAGSVGQGVFAGADTVGAGEAKYVSVVGTAQVTATVWLTTTTTGPVTVTVSGSIPVTVTAPISVTATNGVLYVTDTAEVGGAMPINENIPITGPGAVTQEITGSVGLSGRILVYNPTGGAQSTLVYGSGPVSGQSAPSAVEWHPGLVHYFPLIFKNPAPEGFFDDFSSYGAGIWPEGSLGRCEVSYHNGHYRIRIKDGWSGDSYQCVVITRTPCYQPIGTIGVEARRASNEDYDLWYGLYFSASDDYPDDRWAVEVRPDEVWCDGSDRPYFWLNCLEDGDACWSNKYKCTSDIDTREGEWNEIDITRDGDLATVYINDDEQMTKSSDALSGEGYFNLFAYSEDRYHDIIVEYDDFYATPEVLDID
jgi:hypothetical protein